MRHGVGVTSSHTDLRCGDRICIMWVTTSRTYGNGFLDTSTRTEVLSSLIIVVKLHYYHLQFSFVTLALIYQFKYKRHSFHLLVVGPSSLKLQAAGQAFSGYVIKIHLLRCHVFG